MKDSKGFLVILAGAFVIGVPGAGFVAASAPALKVVGGVAIVSGLIVMGAGVRILLAEYPIRIRRRSKRHRVR